MTDPPPAAPSDSSAALLAEIALLREALGRELRQEEAWHEVLDLISPPWERDDSPSRIEHRKWQKRHQEIIDRLRDLLATPPGASGQAVLDAGDQLTLRLAERDLTTHCMQYHGCVPSACDDNRCRTGREARAAWWQARSGAPSARATGQPSGEGGDGG